MSDPVLRAVVLLQVLRADLRLGHCQQKKSGRTEEQNRQQLRVERLLYWEDGSQLRGSQLRTTSNLGKKPGEPFPAISQITNPSYHRIRERVHLEAIEKSHRRGIFVMVSFQAYVGGNQVLILILFTCCLQHQ